MLSEKRTDGVFGYWWTMFTPSLDAVLAVQGDHPPQPVAPGHAIKLDLNGTELWRVPTAEECWGFDVSPNAEWTAANCDDKMLYLINRQGTLTRKQASPGFQVRFSPDSRNIVAGSPDGTVSLLDVTTGNALWSYPYTRQTIRNVRWSPDGSRITFGLNGGEIAQVKSDGTPLWRRWTGEYPLFLAVDSQHNVYAGGKGRFLNSWDGNGMLRWRVRIQTPYNTLNAVSRDGSYIVYHTTNGELFAYDGSGHVLWERFVPFTRTGQYFA